MAGLQNAFGLAPEDVDKEEALRQLYPTANAGPVTNLDIDAQTAGEFQRGLRSGYYGAVQAAPRAYLGAVQDALGYKDAAQQSYANVRSFLRRAEASRPTTRWDDVKDLDSFGNYVASAVGNAVASTTPGVAVGLATRSPKLGLATMFPMEAGETVADSVADPNAPRHDPGKLLATATTKGAFNTAVEAAPFLHMFGKGPLRGISSGISNPAARFGARALTQMGAEGGTEYVQEIGGQTAKSFLDPGRDTSRDPEDRAEAFRQGFFGALPFGGMAGISGAVQDSKQFAADRVKDAGDFIERSKGKTAAEIFDDVRGKDRTKRFSLAINGNPTAEEDFLKNRDNSMLAKSLTAKQVKEYGPSLRHLAAGIDAYLRGEIGEPGGDPRIEEELLNVFGTREKVDEVLDYYAKGINDTGTLVYKRDDINAEMHRPPAWLDPDGVTSFSEADLDLQDEDRKSYVAEEHGLQSLMNTDSEYYYDGQLTSRRPFANRAAANAGVERVKRMNPAVTNAERISVLQQAYETGRDPEEVRRELYKEVRNNLAKDVARVNRGSPADRERAAKRVRDANDILRKLGEEVVDKDTGEIKFNKSVIEALDNLYVVRANGSADNQNFSAREIANMKPGANDASSTLEFQREDGKSVPINVRALMRAHMKRVDTHDDNGSLVPPKVWMYRALMSGLAGLQNSGLKLVSELKDDLVVAKGTTLADLKAADRAMAYRDRKVENDRIELPEEQAAREYRRDQAIAGAINVGGIAGTNEGPDGSAGYSFDPNANTLREQQPGGAPQYDFRGEEIWGEQQDANIRQFNEYLVGDPAVARVGAAWPATGSTEAQFEGKFKKPEQPQSGIRDPVGTPVQEKIDALNRDMAQAELPSMNRKAIQARARRLVEKAQAERAENEAPPPTDEAPVGEPPAWMDEESRFANREDGANAPPAAKKPTETPKTAEKPQPKLEGDALYAHLKEQADKGIESYQGKNPSLETARKHKAWAEKQLERLAATAKNGDYNATRDEATWALEELRDIASFYVQERDTAPSVKVEAPKAEVKQDLLSRIQNSAKLSDAEYKALVNETRAVLKEAKLPLEERKVLAKALGESGVARTRGLHKNDVSFKNMSAEDAKTTNQLLHAVSRIMFVDALKATETEMAASVRRATEEIVNRAELGAAKRKESFDRLDTTGRVFDRLSGYIEITKNKRAEQYLRDLPIDEVIPATELLDQLYPLLENEQTKVLVRALRKVVGRIRVLKDGGTDGSYRGVYLPHGDWVMLHGAMPDLQTLLHELVHAATVKALPQNQEAFEALASLFEHMNKNKIFRATYGSLNLFEFLAEGMTSSHIQKLMRTTPASDEVRTLLGNVKNMWQAFVRILRQAIGLPEDTENALTQLFDIAGALMRQTGVDDLVGSGEEARDMMFKTSPATRRQYAEELAKLEKALKEAPRVFAAFRDASSREGGYGHVGRTPQHIDVVTLRSLRKDNDILEIAREYERVWGANSKEEIAYIYSVRAERILATLDAADLPNKLDLSRGNVSFSWMTDAVSEKLSPEEMKQLRDIIVKQRGEQVGVMFAEAMNIGGSTRAAGAYIKDDAGKRTIELALDVAFATAESAAYHEAMHDFLASLRGQGTTPEMRAAAATIERLHKNAEVMLQLKELLKNHPEAWKEAQEDPNEAAAYIYQFYVKGLITIGPAPRNLFERIFKFFNDLLGVLSNDEKARMLMSSLAAGEFADPSVAADVINAHKLETFVDKTKRIAGPLYTVTSAMGISATDRLRERNIPALREIADLFHKETDEERGGISYLQKLAQQKAMWNSRLNRILSGYTEAEIRVALDELQGRKNSENKLTTDIRALLKDMYVYMKKAGVQEVVREQVEVWNEKKKMMEKKTVERTVDIREVKENYFPRVWDRDAIKRNEPEFIALLRKYGQISEHEARGIIASITSAAQDNVVDETTYTPYLMSARNRRLHWVNKANAAEFAKFQKHDLVAIMTDYVAHATKRAESTRFFGHGFKKIDELLERAVKEGATNDDIEVANKAVASLTGSLRHDMSDTLRTFMSNMIAYENIVLLPIALLNNLTDIVHISLRSGDVTEGWKAFTTGIRELKNAVFRLPPSEQKRFAEDLGVIDETVALGAYGDAYEGQYMTGFARKLNDAFFKYNGMQTWNHAMRTAALQAGLRFFARHALASQNADSDRYLFELGFTRDEAAKLVDKTTGKVATSRADIAAALGVEKNSKEAEDMETRVHEALYRFVDGAALRPNAAHRPIWGSDPYFMLIFHLKQFTYTFQAVTAKFINKELAYGSVMPVVSLATYAPFALGVHAIRSLLLGRPIDGSLGGIMMALAKSGTMMGTGTFGLDALEDTARNRVPGVSLLGPSLSHALLGLQTLLGADGTSFARLVERSMPLSPIVKAATR